jgi:serine/threonine protein kinase
MTANVGTVHWMAPEVLMGKIYNETADIYSIGMITWELLTGKCPFDGLIQMEV